MLLLFTYISTEYNVSYCVTAFDQCNKLFCYYWTALISEYTLFNWKKPKQQNTISQIIFIMLNLFYSTCLPIVKVNKWTSNVGAKNGSVTSKDNWGKKFQGSGISIFANGNQHRQFDWKSTVFNITMDLIMQLRKNITNSYRQWLYLR